MARAILSITFLLVWLASFSQPRILKMEAQLIVDNDAFTGDLNQDQYYSSGIFPTFRILRDSGEKAKVIRSYQINHRMYTPSWIGWDRLERFDRPYAGVFSISAANEYYFLKGRYLKVELEMGILGPHAYVGNAQRTWHQWFGMPDPNGWKYQINDQPMVNLQLKWVEPLFYAKKVDLFSESSVATGTVFNYFRQDLIFRIGDLKPIHQSAYLSASLGNKGEKKRHQLVQEAYLFYSPGLEWVGYNATLEGNFIGDPSVYTVKATQWVWQHRAGFMFSWPVFDLGITAAWRTRENREANHHNYVGIRLNQRF